MAKFVCIYFNYTYFNTVDGRNDFHVILTGVQRKFTKHFFL